ncbi:MAG: Ti-type conjugative transfer relaxase TraA [Pseudomonadota bacterium]
MAIYHLSAKLISRSTGASALAAAAYRSASRLHDQRLDRHHDFTNKAGVVHSEVMLPEGADEAWKDREKLWNDVEAAELRKDAQLAREIEFALPRELTQQQAIELARDFVQAEFVDRGMVADLNVHWDIGEDGEAKPHAHVMLTTRAVEVGDDGSVSFGAKVRDWNRTDLLTHWREAWANIANERMASLDIDARIDHRSLEAQGIALDPQHKIGPAASRMVGEGLTSERLQEHHAIARSNGEKIIADPNIALDAITRGQATFTTRDLAMFVHRNSDDKDQFDKVMAAVKNAPELVELGRDGKGNERFTSRSMIETERRLELATTRLDAKRNYAVPDRYIERAMDRAKQRGLDLSPEQRSALEHVTSPRGISNVIGYAGTGKSAMLGVAREAWELAGYEVQGAALSGIAAEGLEHGSGIASRTIASLEYQWEQGRELLTDRHVLVIDEAGMLGTRQLERVMSEAERRGAKVVLVGDPEQLQAIEAGAAFRSTAERHGAVEISGIRRQQIDWQRDATRELATGRTGEALARYADAGHIHVAETREAARTALVDAWDRDRKLNPQASRIILTHTNDEVKALNEEVRERMRASGSLGSEIDISVERGSRCFASGDRIMFLKNERELGVKNGSLGTVQSLSSVCMAVMLDDGRQIAFDLKDYAHVDHGYAATVHKAQGMTVDKVQVLATPGMDRHGAYVVLSRHRTRVDLHYGQDDFADRKALTRTLSRERAKDMASDYARQTDRAQGQQKGREVRQPDRVMPERTRTIRSAALADLLKGTERTPLEKAVQRFARASEDIFRMRDQGLTPLDHQQAAMTAASKGMEAIGRGYSHDLGHAMIRDRSLIGEAAAGKLDRTMEAMRNEQAMRIEAQARADRFVHEWQTRSRQLQRLRQNQDYLTAEKVEGRLAEMAHSLERDPQLESLLRSKRPELGLDAMRGKSLSQDLADWLSPSRSRGLGL